MQRKGRRFSTCDAVILEEFAGISVAGRKNPCSENIDKRIESKYIGRNGEEKADQVCGRVCRY